MIFFLRIPSPSFDCREIMYKIMKSVDNNKKWGILENCKLNALNLTFKEVVIDGKRKCWGMEDRTVVCG